jgi:hypothetical protein
MVLKPGANPAPKTVAIDFDGVLADYHGWKNEDTLDPPFPGAQAFVAKVVRAGYQVIVHTTRNPDRVRQWLADWDFSFPVTVSNRKPKAMVYIDDRGFRFTGDWEAAFQAIEQPTHWKK